MSIANTTIQNMNFRTIAFNKGHLLVKNYIDNQNTDSSVYDDLSLLVQAHPMIMNMQLELMRFGYMFDEDSLRCLAAMTDEELEVYANDLVDYLADAFGDGCFVTLFGDFPHTVLKMTEIEMFIHQIFHYLSGGAYSPAMPSCDDAELAMLHSNYDGRLLKDSYRKITPISFCDFANYFKTVLSGQQSLTDYDKKAVEYLCKNYSLLGVDSGDVFPEDIPFKETLCIVLANAPVEDYMPKTINDVLRYAVYLSGGDVSLPSIPTKLTDGWSRLRSRSRYNATDSILRERYKARLAEQRKAFKFSKFSRGQRRDILEMMEYVISHCSWNNVAEDMKKYLGRWVRLGEILHPGEYANKYPKTNEMFIYVRNSGQYIQTYGGRLRAAREANDVDLLLSIYKERPGELLRNIDNLLRNYPSNTDDILDAVNVALKKSSTKMLYELMEHFYSRNDDGKRRNRVATIKGVRGKYVLPCLPKMDDAVIFQLMTSIESILCERFAAKESMKNKIVLLDKSLSDILLPKNMRAMNFAPGQLAQGSRIKIQNTTGILRCYCRWVDKLGQYDLDLATSMYNENFQFVASISWNSYYKQDVWAVFSGDVRHRRGNCAEYIDIDINKALAVGVRYVVATVCDFDGEGFLKKDAWGGIMERSQMGTPGELTWAPETISTGFRLASKCTNIIMTVIDLKEMYMYVADEDVNGIPVAVRASGNLYGEIAKRYVNAKPYFTALELINKNCVARNASVKILSSEDFAEKVEKYEDMKKKYLAMIKQYDEELASDTLRPEQRKLFETTRTELVKAYDNLEKNLITISYDDIAADYTKLLEWMF